MGSFSVLNKEVTLPTNTHYSVKGGKQPINQNLQVFWFHYAWFFQ